MEELITAVGSVDGRPRVEEGGESGGVTNGVVVCESDADPLVRKQGELNSEGAEFDLVGGVNSRRHLCDELMEIVSRLGMVGHYEREVIVGCGDCEGEGVAGGVAGNGRGGGGEGEDDFG